jgi:flagellar assembly protein FliH
MSKIIKASAAEAHTYPRYEREDLDAAAAPVAEKADPAEFDAAVEEIRSQLEAEHAATVGAIREEAAEKVRQAYAEGQRRGLEAGKQEFADHVASAEAAVKDAAEGVRQALEESAQRVEDKIIGLAESVVRRILQREAWFDRDAVRRTLEEAFAALTDKEHVKIRMHPDDVAMLNEESVGFLEQFEGSVQRELVPDESVDKGGCIVETDSQYVDATLEAQLERILDQLGEIPCEPPEPATS